MVKEISSKSVRNGASNFYPQPHPRLSKLREAGINQSSVTASNSYEVKRFQVSLTDSLPDLLETSSLLSTSTSPSTASSASASFSSSTSTSASSSSSSSSSSGNRSYVLSEPISSFLPSKQQQHHIYEDIDVRGPIRMTPVSGVMLESKKGLIKPLPFKASTVHVEATVSNNSSKKSHHKTTKSCPMNNLNVQQVHQGTLEGASSVMCNRTSASSSAPVASSDLQRKLSDRVCCQSPFHCLVDDSTVNRTLDLPHQMIASSAVSSYTPTSGRGGSLLTTASDFASHPLPETREHNQLAGLADPMIHHSPLTYAMTCASSSSGIGDSSSSSGHSFTSNSQCSMSQSSYQMDDDTAWYSPGSFDAHTPVEQQQPQPPSRSLIDAMESRPEKAHRVNNNNSVLQHNHNNERNNKTSDNPTLPPRQRTTAVSVVRGNNTSAGAVERSSTFNSNDLTMVTTPSPCGDSIQGMTMSQIASLVREKDAQISYLRETLEQNEQVIFKVYEEKEQSWQKEYKKLRTQFESSLMLYQQKALKAQSDLAFATKQADDERNSLLVAIDMHKESNILLERKVAELSRQLTSQLTASSDDGKQLTHANDHRQMNTDERKTEVSTSALTLDDEATKKMKRSNILSNNSCTVNSCKLNDRQVQQVKPFSTTEYDESRVSGYTSSSQQLVPSTLQSASVSVETTTIPVSTSTSRKLPKCIASTSDSGNSSSQECHNFTCRHDFCNSPNVTAGVKSDFDSPVITLFTNYTSPLPDTGVHVSHLTLTEQMTRIQSLQDQVSQLVNKLNASEKQLYTVTIENTDLKQLEAKLTSQVNSMRDSFNMERAVWKDEKDKVIHYQKQLNRNFLHILQRNKELELQIKSLKQSSNIASLSNTIYQITTGETTC